MQERLNNLAQGIKERLNKNKDIDFEIYLKSKQGTNINLKSGKKETYEKKDSLGFSIRILKNEQMAFSYGTDFSYSAKIINGAKAPGAAENIDVLFL